MASTLDFLSQGVPSAVPSGSDSSTVGPLWLQQYLMDTMGASRALASQPYSPYPGPTVAGPSGQTQQAWDMAGSNVGNYSPYLMQAGALSAASGAPISSGDISTFLNPYSDYITGALNRNLTQNLLPTIQDKFVSAGQSRSPQEQEMTQRALQGTQTAVGESMAGAYQGALNSLLANRQQMGTAGAQLGQLGALSSQLGAVDVGQLAAAGNAQDALAQANINSAQQQFNQQQQYPYQQVGFMSDVVRGLPVGAAGSTTQTVGMQYPNAYPPSPINSFLNGALGASSLGLARGGRVTGRRYVEGRPYRMGALSHRLSMAA